MKPSTLIVSCALSLVACGDYDHRARDASSQTTTTIATYEVPQVAAAPVAPMAPTAHETFAAVTRRDSTKLSAEIRRSLAGDPSLSVAARSVRVSANGETITLRGTVESEEERAKVEKHARATKGVTDLNDEILIGR
jgi:osmotically-inducible protein OsmY